MENDKMKKDEEFESLVRPLMKYLADNYHPHAIVIVNTINAQILEGTITTDEILDYVKD